MLADVPSNRIVLARTEEPQALRQAVAQGQLVRVRRGAYVHPETAPARGDSAETRARALVRAHAVHRQMRAPHVFSHETAALLWGLRTWTVAEVTHLRQRSRAGGERARDVARHVGVPERHMVIDGLPVTSLEQTVLDCALTLPVLDGLVVTDAALGQGLRVEVVRDLLAAVRKPNGRARAAMVLTLADGGAESAWETWLRYIALWRGLPRPTLQLPVPTRLGRFRVDVAWTEHRVLAEFDGQVKYADGAFGPDYSGRRALVEEKRREDAIAEAFGVRPLRFMATDARDPESVAQRLLAKFPPVVRASARIDRRLPRLAPWPSSR